MNTETRTHTNSWAKLAADDSGEIPIGPLLMIGLVVIPLVIGLVTFGEEVSQYMRQQWDLVGNSTGPISF